MTAEHLEAVLNELLDRRPFRPFTVELHGGRRFEIDHPRATVFRNGVACFIAPGTTFIYFEHDSVNRFIDAPASADV